MAKVEPMPFEVYDTPADEWRSKYSYEKSFLRAARLQRVLSRWRERNSDPYYYYMPEVVRVASHAISAAVNVASETSGHKVSENDALELALMKKAEEEEWVKIFTQGDHSPEFICKAFQNYVDWVDEVQPWHPGNDTYSFFPIPHRITHVVNNSVAEAYYADPGLRTDVLESFAKLAKGASNELSQETRGPYINIMERTKDVLGIVNGSSEMAEYHYPNREAINTLIYDLTQQGIIEPHLWYKAGVTGASKLPDISFAERLLMIFNEGGDNINPRRNNHDKYYQDAARFAYMIIESFTDDDRRNKHSAEVILQLIQVRRDVQRKSLSPADFITVANALIKKANEVKAIESDEEPDELIDRRPENLPLAILYLGSVTRYTEISDEVADQLEYEESIYCDVLSVPLGKAIKLHGDWFNKKLQSNSARYRAVMPRTFGGKGAALKRNAGYWNRWRPGFGKLT